MINMVELGYWIAGVLIAMIVIMRGYPIVQDVRAGKYDDWFHKGRAVREQAQAWTEGELNVGRVEPAPVRYI